VFRFNRISYEDDCADGLEYAPSGQPRALAEAVEHPTYEALERAGQRPVRALQP